jgi:hypothetical protein
MGNARWAAQQTGNLCPHARTDSSSGLEARTQPDSRPPLADNVAQRLLY